MSVWWSLAMTSVPRLSHPYVTDNYGMAAEGHGGNKVELFISSAWQSPGVCPKLGFKLKKKIRPQTTTHQTKVKKIFTNNCSEVDRTATPDMCPVLTVGHSLWSSQTPCQFCVPWWAVLCTTSCTMAYLLWAQIKITLAVLAVTSPCWLILSWQWKPRVFFTTCARIQLHSFPCRTGTVGDLRSQSVEPSAWFS